jgi:hypothetical protein
MIVDNDYILNENMRNSFYEYYYHYINDNNI